MVGRHKQEQGDKGGKEGYRSWRTQSCLLVDAWADPNWDQDYGCSDPE